MEPALAGVTLDVEVLRRTIAISDAERRALATALSPDELAQMRTFLRDADQRRFLVGRATLRRAAARRLGIAAAAVPLARGAHGKPHVAGLASSVSHAGEVVLVAVATGAEVGIDVERVDETLVSSRLDDVFSPREIDAHLALPAALRLASFFHIWTSKEAIVKAIATGLSLSLQAFDVAVDPRAPPALLAVRDPALAGPLSLTAIEVLTGHVATLAVCAPTCRVAYA